MTPPKQLSNSYRRYLAAIVLFHLAAAEDLGLTVTDYQACNILEMEGALTSGELGQRLGLTTGAATRAIDRLVDAGYARRTVDPSDRRRVVVEHTDLLPKNLEGLLAHVRAPIAKVVEQMSPEQLSGLQLYLEGATAAYADALAQLGKDR